MEIDRITRGSQFCSDLPILLTIEAEDLTVIHRVLSDPAWPRLPLPFCSLSTASGLPVQGLCPGGPWGPGVLVPLVTVWVIPSSPWPTWPEWKLRSSPLQHSASLSPALLCSIALITHQHTWQLTCWPANVCLFPLECELQRAGLSGFNH